MASAAVLLAALAIGALTLVPHPAQARLAALTPWTCLVCGELGGVDVVLNVLLFVPLGAALRHAGLRPRHAAAVGLVASVSIELLQAFAVPGRDGTVSDVVTNTLGAALGAWLATHRTALLLPTPRRARHLAAGAIAAWAALLAAGALAYRPAPIAPPLRVAWAPVRPLLERFQGRVLSATDGTTPLADRGMLPRSVSTALEARAFAVAAVVAPGPPTPGFAPILDATDDGGRPLFALGRDGNDLVFGVRTGADALRLRGASVRLRGAFTPGGSDSLVIRGGVDGAKIWVERGGPARERSELRLDAGQGWRLVSPVAGPMDRRVAWLFTAMWVGGPLGLAAWWAAAVRRRREPPAGRV